MSRADIKNTGFTLLELVVALVIVGALMSFAIPRFNTSVERARAAEGEQMAMATYAAQKRFQIDTGAYTAVLGNLDIQFTLGSDYFDTPTVSTVDPIVSVVRNQNSTTLYTFRVTGNGTLSCIDGTVDCSKVGH